MTSLALAAISYTTAGAVAATGIGESTIEAAIRDGDLIAHYVGRKRVLLATDLHEWIESLPTERRSA